MPVPTAVGDAAGGSMSPLWVSGVNNVFANEASYETLGGAPARPPPGPVGAVCQTEEPHTDNSLQSIDRGDRYPSWVTWVGSAALYS